MKYFVIFVIIIFEIKSFVLTAPVGIYTGYGVAPGVGIASSGFWLGNAAFSASAHGTSATASASSLGSGTGSATGLGSSFVSGAGSGGSTGMGSSFA